MHTSQIIGKTYIDSEEKNFLLPDNRQYATCMINCQYIGSIMTAKKARPEKSGESSMKSKWIKVIFLIKKDVVTMKGPYSMTLTIFQWQDPIHQC